MVTRVSEHVDADIVPYIERLVSNNMAYEIKNDGVYFDVRSFEAQMQGVTKYGKLAPPAQATDFFNIDDSNATNHKRDPRDFALWKVRKDKEPMYWPSPWGQGRPGWHIECSAMIEAVQRRFRDTHTFSVHAGGVDLCFPHHTNEIAQAEAYHHNRDKNADTAAKPRKAKEWIPHWLHLSLIHI